MVVDDGGRLLMVDWIVQSTTEAHNTCYTNLFEAVGCIDKKVDLQTSITG